MQGYVSRLRKLLSGSAVETVAKGYRLWIKEGALDVERFKSLLEQGRRLQAEGNPEQSAALLGQAIALWRGPALADFSYEPFARDAIGQLEELRLEALELQLEAELALGLNAEAVSELGGLVRNHPPRESLRRLLMLALYRSGRQAAALATYRDARVALVEELGLEPSRSLQLLERAILQHDPSLDRAAPARAALRTNIPAPATVFVGRGKEISNLVEVLRDGTRLLTLTGPGGTGKTRLALQTAAAVSEEFPDGVWWVPLASLHDPALVLLEVARTLNVNQSDRELAEVIAEALDGMRLLLLIDNAEHLLPVAADCMGELVAACPSVTVVVTSRERLRIAGERVFAVPPMTETDAELLFRNRAADAGVELEDSDALRTLCARLDNLPLALELAAARMPVFSPAQLLDRLPQRLDLLKRGNATDARQETLRATITWSHDLLQADDKQLFRLLERLRWWLQLRIGRAGRRSGHPDTLKSLLDKSLLRRRDTPTGPRFSMLETIRAYATERLIAAGEGDDFQRRHLDHYAALAEACHDETWNRTRRPRTTRRGTRQSAARRQPRSPN